MSTADKTIPLAQYGSLLGVHTTLLAFAAVFLPRTSQILIPLPPQASSRDRPQHPLLHPLTADPSLTLAWLCAGATLLQPWWASWLRLWLKQAQQARAQGFGNGDEGKSSAQRLIDDSDTNSQKFIALTDALKATMTSSIAFYIAIVLLGAPIASHFTQSYLLALLLAFLTVYPPVYSLRSPSLASDTASLVHRLTWVRLFAELRPRTAHERALVYPAIGTIIGAWAGAFPIALDWDRPWQAWPLTPAYGAIVGYILSAWCALLVSGTHFLADADIRSQSEPETGASVSQAVGKTAGKAKAKERKKTK